MKAMTDEAISARTIEDSPDNVAATDSTMCSSKRHSPVKSRLLNAQQANSVMSLR